MKTLKTVVIVLGLIFIAVTAAEAVDLFAGPLFVVTGALYCDIVNVGTTTKVVLIQVIDDGGAVLNEGTYTLPPWDVEGLPGVPNGYGYCRFSFTGAKTSVRAAAKIYSGVNDVVAIPAQ